MSVTLALPVVSNARQRRWLITVIIVMVLVSGPFARIIGAYADAAAFVALLLGGCGTAAKYRNRSNRPNPAASV
jgi:hypothetical protein